MIKKGKDLKSELDELKRLTEELREVKENESNGMCPDCKRYASIAYKAAEKYYEVLIRAEIIEATWYRKGGLDCDMVECDCKKENLKLKNKIDEASKQLTAMTMAPFTEAGVNFDKREDEPKK